MREGADFPARHNGRGINRGPFIQNQTFGDRVYASKSKLASRQEIITCRQLLKGTGLTMHQAVRLALQHRNPSIDRSIPEILETFLINRGTIRNNRSRTIDEYRCQLGKFANDFGDRPIASITAGEIEDWLRMPHFDNKGRKRTWAGSRRNVTRGYIATLFNFGIRKNLCSSNPCAGVDKAIVERAPIEVWAPAETITILNVATEECPELLCFLVLALFSGIRTGELFWLHTDHLRLDQGVVTVPAAISKTRKLRNIPIAENLSAWLAHTKAHAPSGRVWEMGESSLHRRYRLIEKGATFKWRRNALRHTFASCHLALHDNEYLTSRACGNTPRMLREHYDAIVSREHAHAHFNIFPSSVLHGQQNGKKQE